MQSKAKRTTEQFIKVNAWCMAGGKIAVYTGLIEKVKPTDDELAQVLAMKSHTHWPTMPRRKWVKSVVARHLSF